MDSAGGAEAPKAPPLNPPLVKDSQSTGKISDHSNQVLKIKKLSLEK